MGRSSHPDLTAFARLRFQAASGIVLLAVIGFSCAPFGARATPPGEPTSTPAPPHAAEIRFGLIGKTTGQNVWALFAGHPYSYNDYAVRSQHWPRLFGLAVPGGELQPLAAADVPTTVVKEGIFYTAAVPIRTDLVWSDGTPFGPGDVAFTVNTAVAFELPFDWQDFYDPAQLDHAEEVASDSVKFYFRSAPGVDSWQYGALQGPVVQEDYWARKVALAAEHLPPSELQSNINVLRDRVAKLQQEANDLYAATLSAQGDQARQLQADLKRKQGSLDEAINDLSDAETAYQEALDAARLALFGQNDSGEPLLGAWLPGTGASISNYVNVPNATYPVTAPNFDRAVYRTYTSVAQATAALQRGEINLILSPEAVQPEPAGTVIQNPARSMRFLLFNPDADGLADPALRRALACVIDQDEFAAAFDGSIVARSKFIAAEDETWSDPEDPPCADRDAPARLAEAVGALRSAGYTWATEPSAQGAGQGLRAPDGGVVPDLQLLTPMNDEGRVSAAEYVARQALRLGVNVRVQGVTADAIDYAVLSSRDFDMAILGSRLSPYPGYLCQWYGTGGAFHYYPSEIPALCQQLGQTADMAEARDIVAAIQRVLSEEVPLVPLYSPMIREIVNGISYPFDALPDGLARAYGAPSWAIPAGP